MNRDRLVTAPNRAIACRSGRNASTILRELARNRARGTPVYEAGRRRTHGIVNKGGEGRMGNCPQMGADTEFPGARASSLCRPRASCVEANHSPRARRVASSRRTWRMSAMASSRFSRHSSRVRPWPFAPTTSGQNPVYQSPSRSIIVVNRSLTIVGSRSVRLHVLAERSRRARSIPQWKTVLSRYLRPSSKPRALSSQYRRS